VPLRPLALRALALLALPEPLEWQADATRLALVRASLGRRGCRHQPARERLPDEEPGNLRRFRRTEAARCYARA
jgi:hypothetical protein